MPDQNYVQPFSWFLPVLRAHDEMAPTEFHTVDNALINFSGRRANVFGDRVSMTFVDLPGGSVVDPNTFTFADGTTTFANRDWYVCTGIAMPLTPERSLVSPLVVLLRCRLRPDVCIRLDDNDVFSATLQLSRDTDYVVRAIRSGFSVVVTNKQGPNWAVIDATSSDIVPLVLPICSPDVYGPMLFNVQPDQHSFELKRRGEPTNNQERTLCQGQPSRYPEGQCKRVVCSGVVDYTVVLPDVPRVHTSDIDPNMISSAPYHVGTDADLCHGAPMQEILFLESKTDPFADTGSWLTLDGEQLLHAFDRVDAAGVIYYYKDGALNMVVFDSVDSRTQVPPPEAVIFCCKMDLPPGAFIDPTNSSNVVFPDGTVVPSIAWDLGWSSVAPLTQERSLRSPLVLVARAAGVLHHTCLRASADEVDSVVGQIVMRRRHGFKEIAAEFLSSPQFVTPSFHDSSMPVWGEVDLGGSPFPVYFPIVASYSRQLATPTSSTTDIVQECFRTFKKANKYMVSLSMRFPSQEAPDTPVHSFLSQLGTQETAFTASVNFCYDLGNHAVVNGFCMLLPNTQPAEMAQMFTSCAA